MTYVIPRWLTYITVILITPVDANLTATSLKIQAKHGWIKGMPKPTVCSVKLVGHHSLFRQSLSRSVTDIIDFMEDIVEKTSAIFEKTDFDGDGHNEDLTLKINKIELFFSADSPNNPFHHNFETMSLLLDQFTSNDPGDDNFCLSIVFVSRRFDTRVIGIGHYLQMTDAGESGACRGKYNKIAINIKNVDNTRLTTAQIVASLTHEIAHAFGALAHFRRESMRCSLPFNQDILMKFYLPSDTVKLEELSFSPCTIDKIRHVLELGKLPCLTHAYPVCGNAITEEREECDCGLDEYCDLVDPCCTPSGGIGSDKGCKLRRRSGAVCSSREDYCCTADCLVVPAYSRHECSLGDCYISDICSGNSSKCPELVQKADRTACKNGLGECIDGECLDVVCKEANMFECNCRDVKEECLICCEVEGLCMPASKWGYHWRSGETIYRPVGESCRNGRGRCSLTGVCRMKPVSNLTLADNVEVKEEEKWSIYIHLLIGLIVLVALAVLLGIGYLVYKVYLFTKYGGFKKEFVVD